ncbi:hypothetical protein BIW11_03319, partial [Tropilaelaps mercedesae]
MPSVAVSPASSRTPLRGKKVFLDTKSSSVQLRRQLEALGARVDPFFSKDIWCVITDKQIRGQDNRSLSLLCGAISQSSESSPLGAAGKRSPFLNRTQALLQAAQRRELKEKGSRAPSAAGHSKVSDEVQSVAHECRQWDIPLVSVKSAQQSVAKLVKKYQPDGLLPPGASKR